MVSVFFKLSNVQIMFSLTITARRLREVTLPGEASGPMSWFFSLGVVPVQARYGVVFASHVRFLS